MEADADKHRAKAWDACMIACLDTGREFIGIEQSGAYFAIAKKRLAAHQPRMSLFGSLHKIAAMAENPTPLFAAEAAP